MASAIRAPPKPATGANANNPAVKIACFPTRVVDGDVYVELP